MRLKLPQLAEVHTSEMSDACPRSAYHRLRGELDAEVGLALFRGLAEGMALEVVHNSGEVEASGALAESIVDSAVNEALKKLAEENRKPSESVQRDINAIAKEMVEVTEAYCRRLGKCFDADQRLIGVEVPIRCGDPTWAYPFASHIDLLTEDRHNHRLWDWKWCEEQPTQAYLDRSPQLASYWYGYRYGEVLTSPELGLWETPERWPTVHWIHLANLKPVKRKTTFTTPEGEMIELKKGDERPLSSIIRTCRFKAENADRVRDEIAHRMEMMCEGFWPQIPDKVGCHLCDSRDWCASAAY